VHCDVVDGRELSGTRKGQIRDCDHDDEICCSFLDYKTRNEKGVFCLTTQIRKLSVEDHKTFKVVMVKRGLHYSRYISCIDVISRR
jgi:hypothetical protein